MKKCYDMAMIKPILSFHDGRTDRQSDPFLHKGNTKKGQTDQKANNDVLLNPTALQDG